MSTFVWILPLFPLTLFFSGCHIVLSQYTFNQKANLGWENSFGKLHPRGQLLSFSSWVKVTKNNRSSFIFLSVSPYQQWTLTFECRNKELGNNFILGTYGSDRSFFYFWDGVSWSPGWPCTSYVPENDPELPNPPAFPFRLLGFQASSMPHQTQFM